MERNVTMAEISDGKLYSRDDMVKAGCDDCRGCSACCHGMGNSIVLDPYDVYRLTTLRGDTLEHLLEEKKVEWNVVDGQILPNLALRSRADEACGFLDEAGRCRIHAYRPGICRPFHLYFSLSASIRSKISHKCSRSASLVAQLVAKRTTV